MRFARCIAPIGLQRGDLAVGRQRLERLSFGTRQRGTQVEQRDAVGDLGGRGLSQRTVDGLRACRVAAGQSPEGFMDARLASCRLACAPDFDRVALQGDVARAPRGAGEWAERVVAQPGGRHLAGHGHRIGELPIGHRDRDGVGRHAATLLVGQRGRQPLAQLLQGLGWRDATGATRDDQGVVL
jgi:hypothetical protein